MGSISEYQKAIDLKVRKDLIGRLQKLIHEKVMYLSLTTTGTLSGLGPRVKWNPFNIQPLLSFACPFEDVELAE